MKAEYVALYLRNHRSSATRVKCTLAILTNKNEEINRVGFEVWVKPEGAFGTPTFILRDEIFLHRNEWLLNDELRIVARVIWRFYN